MTFHHKCSNRTAFKLNRIELFYGFNKTCLLSVYWDKKNTWKCEICQSNSKRPLLLLAEGCAPVLQVNDEQAEEEQNTNEIPWCLRPCFWNYKSEYEFDKFISYY